MAKTPTLRVEDGAARGPEIRGAFCCAACGKASTAGAMLGGRARCYTCSPELMPKGVQPETRTAAVVRVAHGTRCASCRERIVRGQMSKARPLCHRCARAMNATGPLLEVDAAPARKSAADFERDWQAGR